VGVAMPPTVGHVAINARYLKRQQRDDSTIAAAVTMSQLVNIVTTVLLLIVFGVLTGSGFSRLKIAPGGDVLIGLGVIVFVLIVVLSVPQTRAMLAGNAVGSATPTPGGIGGVEAVMSAGLTAIGIPAHQAIPAVLIFRLATFWLPIPAGWVSYLMLQRRGTL